MIAYGLCRVAEFVGVDECNYFCEQSNATFFGGWAKDECVKTKMSSLSMDNVPDYVSSYFTKWSANIIEYVSTIGNQICLSAVWLACSFQGAIE